MAFKDKYQVYKHLQLNIAGIYTAARVIAEETGIPREVQGESATGQRSGGFPAWAPADSMEAAGHQVREAVPPSDLTEDIRKLVKSAYGDDYDTISYKVCSTGVWPILDVLSALAVIRGGGRGRCLVPLEKNYHHQGVGGLGFPGYCQRLNGINGEKGLDMVAVPLVGACYAVHGIKYQPVPLLTAVDPGQSAKQIRKFAALHTGMLTGITSLAYETPGCGYGAKNSSGTPELQKSLAAVTQDYDIPYVMDNTGGLPFIGSDPRKTGADVVLYNLGQPDGIAFNGLVIGKAEAIAALRRAFRPGKSTVYACDQKALTGQLLALNMLRDMPGRLTQPVDMLEKIVGEEFAAIHPALKDGILISKSYNSLAVEINYEGTWKNGQLGIPIFSREDTYSGTNIFQTVMRHMGLMPTVTYEGNICLSPGGPSVDSQGRLLPGVARRAVKGLVRLIELVSRYAGII